MAPPPDDSCVEPIWYWASSFSSRIMRGNEVLIDGSQSGIISLPGDIVTTTRLGSPYFSRRLEQAAAYAQRCYDANSVSIDCQTFWMAINTDTLATQKAALNSPFLEPHPEFGLVSSMASFGNGSIMKESSSIEPIAELTNLDTDLVLIFLLPRHVQFLGASNDLWYRESALSDATVIGTLEQGGQKTEFYQTAEPAWPMGCTLQYQICDRQSCTGLGSYNDTLLRLESEFGLAFSFLGFPYPFIGLESLYNLIMVLGRKALASTYKGTSGIRAAAVKDEWHVDVRHWFATILANLQQSLAEIAAGPIISGAEELRDFIRVPSENEMQQYCKNQKIRSSEYISFSMFWIPQWGASALIIYTPDCDDSLFRIVTLHQLREMADQGQSLEPILLFSFPSEVRNFIYAKLLVHAEPIRILSLYLEDGNSVRGYRNIDRDGLGLDLAILTSNHRIRDEANVVFYSHNAFRFSGDTCFPRFLEMIGPSNAALLRKIEIRFPGLSHDSCWSLVNNSRLPEARNLAGLSKPVCDLLVNNCGGLTTIKMAINATPNALTRAFKGPLTIEDMEAGVDAINARLRTIPTLRRIHAKVYEDNPNEDAVATVLAMMCSYGWVVSAHFQGQFDRLGSIGFEFVQAGEVDIMDEIEADVVFNICGVEAYTLIECGSKCSVAVVLSSAVLIGD
ncbi:hypothetical protein HJFPF1_13093 [Paramyrothecium foliicola]|nr:hypothetical protein HJFPF1_13093 [Paramyrothecium foliicola]